MTSMFDSSVYQRRKYTPWARMSLMAFANEMLFNGCNLTEDQDVSFNLKITPRKDVDTGKWFEVSWISCDGQRRCACSKELDLCLYRAAEIELNARKKVEIEFKNETL